MTSKSGYVMQWISGNFFKPTKNAVDTYKLIYKPIKA